MASEVKEFLTVARRLVREVNPLIDRAVAAESRNPKTKSDGTFVTDTDVAVENYFTEKLRDAFPSTPILGEETAAHQCSKGKLDSRSYYAAFMQAPLQIVIDPIDGTKNFVEGKPEFCIAAALTARVGNGIWPLAGVVAIPVKGVMYWSDENDVYREEIQGGGIVRIERCCPANIQISINSRDRTWLAEHDFSILHPWVSSGSSVHDFLGTALGELHGSMVGTQRLWDLMAPLAIAERLGCVLLDFSSGHQVGSLTPDDLSTDLEDRPWGLTHRMMIVGGDVSVSDLIRRA